jgi:hypothetical protein
LFKEGKAPTQIDTTVLLVKDRTTSSGWRPKKGILPPKMAENKYDEDFSGHYRRITVNAWYLLVEMYGVIGPAIAVYGEPSDDKSRWSIFKDPMDIDKVGRQLPNILYYHRRI